MADLIEVAFVGDQGEADMLQALLEAHGIRCLQQQVGPSGPQLGYGLMNPGGGSRRMMVHAERAEEARAIVAAARADHEQVAPDPVNARHLEEAEGGRGPRNYGVIGAYARALAVAFVVFALIFAVWLLGQTL